MISVPEPIQERVKATYGAYYEGLSRIPAEKCARDALDEEKVHDQVALFCRTFGLDRSELRGKRLLEVGSGFAVFLAVLRRDYGVESFGVEPAAAGFGESFDVSREVLRSYGLDPSIVANAKGEDLPYPDRHFDFIFSSTVLEHTEDPPLVLAEAIRVLKPGGRMQFVFPNYGAFFEGHYALPWIPYMGRALGKAWVSLWGRDPAYIGTLHLTNYYKTRRWLRPHRDIEVVSYGKSVFRERMLGNEIRDWAGLGTVARWVGAARRMRLVRPITWLLLRVGSFDPIVLSAVRKPDGAVPPPPDNLSIYEMRWSDWTDMKAYGPSSRWLRSLVGDHLRWISAPRPPSRVLDLGCGEGSTTAFLANSLRPADVLGIDRSEAGIQCARGRYRGSNLRFECQDDTAALADRTFDLVTCFEVLEHVEDWRAMTREMARLTNKHLMVSFPAGRMRPFERNVGHLRNFRRGQFERFAASIGLQPVAVFYAGFPFFSPLFREACDLINSGSNSLTIGRYSWWLKRTGDILYFFFRHLSMKHRGAQFCGLFSKDEPVHSG